MEAGAASRELWDYRASHCALWLRFVACATICRRRPLKNGSEATISAPMRIPASVPKAVSISRSVEADTTRSPRRAGHGQVQPHKNATKSERSTGKARKRHGLFRYGAFGAAHIRRPSIQHSGVVFPPGPNSWPLNIPAACWVPRALRSLRSAGSVARLLHTAG
jgi:hypothetical protein